MLLRAMLACLGFAALFAASPPASAGIFSGFFRGLGRDAAGGAVEKIEPALARTIADVDVRLSKQEGQVEAMANSLVYKVSKQAEYRLDQVDGILEKRILQLKVGADDVLDHGLDKIDRIAEARLKQVSGIVAQRISQLDAAAKNRLDQTDKILKDRIADVRLVVTGAISQADEAVAARVRQLDEAAGKRLGNVDVIATKQRLGLERTVTRAAWLVGLVVFVVFLLRALWAEYVRVEATLASDKHASKRRLRAYAWAMSARLLRHGLVGALGAVLLAVVPSLLPFTATKELDSVIQVHATGMETALAELDFTRLSFHASQLELLHPADAARYRAMAAKGDLLRELLGRPTALATSADVSSVMDRVQALERVQAGRADPDGQTVRAMILWQQGEGRADKRQAATLATRALWGSPRGFTLAPLARLVVEGYLSAPYLDVLHDGAPPSKSEPLDSMLAAVAVPTPIMPGSPFEKADTLFRLIARLRAAADPAFVKMVEQQALVELYAKQSRRNARPEGDELSKALEARGAAADEIIAAWKSFDAAIRDNRALSSDPLVLGVFRTNDAMLSHALWFATQPEIVDWPKALAEMNGTKDQAIKLAIAPARLVWARRYASLIEGPARELIEMQEAERFRVMETATLTFEKAYAAYARSKTSADAKQRLGLALGAASAAADLGLYVEKGRQEWRCDGQGGPGTIVGKGKVPYGFTIAGVVPALCRQASAAPAPANIDTDPALAKSVQRLRAHLLGESVVQTI